MLRRSINRAGSKWSTQQSRTPLDVNILPVLEQRVLVWYSTNIISIGALRGSGLSISYYRAGYLRVGVFEGLGALVRDIRVGVLRRIPYR